ncbi:MAG: DUF2905 domain-containing protein [Candidatus Margulisbacteria bacterium]|nr:DUF2905 domain-containing protein [Candidatus Margulisiibacteriota bacterium]
MQDMGKMLIIFGVILIIVGGALIIGPKIPFLGRLPGDIYIKKDNFTFIFPITTMVLLSVILTIIVNFFFRK